MDSTLFRRHDCWKCPKCEENIETEWISKFYLGEEIEYKMFCGTCKITWSLFIRSEDSSDLEYADNLFKEEMEMFGAY